MPFEPIRPLQKHPIIVVSLSPVLGATTILVQSLFEIKSAALKWADLSTPRAAEWAQRCACVCASA